MLGHRKQALGLTLLCVLATSCVMANQSGQALPDPVYQGGDKSLGEVTFDFHTKMNYLSVLLRFAVLADPPENRTILLRRSVELLAYRPPEFSLNCGPGP